MIKNYKIYLNTFIILIIVFLLNSKLLSNFVWTASSLFIDFKIPLEWLRCHSLGVNLLTLEALNCGIELFLNLITVKLLHFTL